MSENFDPKCFVKAGPVAFTMENELQAKSFWSRDEVVVLLGKVLGKVQQVPGYRIIDNKGA